MILHHKRVRLKKFTRGHCVWLKGKSFWEIPATTFRTADYPRMKSKDCGTRILWEDVQ
jgi:hypothetical protein